ncbi:MAG: RNA polymerase subunit sigma-70 [Planctomycetaceae bacterium]|nr:RNA polymerase subunit sigma-70 [Planctomycetaceae bacterium]
MVLSDIDRTLLQRCLERKPQAWEDFTDRFLGLVVHVINHSSQCRSIRITNQDREDLCAEVFLTLVADDFSVLRRFRGESSLATYLTVIARRVVVRELLKHKPAAKLGDAVESVDQDSSHEANFDDADEVERLLGNLAGKEADVVRMFHLEGKTYQQISSAVGIPENSIGPTLSRARAKMFRSSGVS